MTIRTTFVNNIHPVTGMVVDQDPAVVEMIVLDWLQQNPGSSPRMIAQATPLSLLQADYAARSLEVRGLLQAKYERCARKVEPARGVWKYTVVAQ